MSSSCGESWECCQRSLGLCYRANLCTTCELLHVRCYPASNIVRCLKGVSMFITFGCFCKSTKIWIVSRDLMSSELPSNTFSYSKGKLAGKFIAFDQDEIKSWFQKDYKYIKSLNRQLECTWNILIICDYLRRLITSKCYNIYNYKQLIEWRSTFVMMNLLISCVDQTFTSFRVTLTSSTFLEELSDQYWKHFIYKYKNIIVNKWIPSKI